jgi:flagellar basal-body rod protein FlgF
MINGLYKSAWGAMASQIRHEVIANNMANVNTPGFRPDWAVLRGYKTRSEAIGEAARPDRRILWSVGGGAMVAETRTAHRSGPLRSTGLSTDLAITENRGFFMVEKDEQIRFTRAGNFRVTADGELVTADGSWRVLGDGGSPMQVGSGNFQVGVNGEVRSGATGEVLGVIALRDFERPDLLQKAGENLFYAPGGAGELQNRPESRIQQGSLELSGTNAAQTMVSMIEAMRAYEANINFVRMQDQLLGRAVTEIARLGG